MSFGSRSVPECPRANSRRARECGALLAELLVAMAIMAGVLVPLAFSVAAEKRLARATYQRAVAMELVDGEMEILAAGEWRVFPPGTHAYQVRSHSVTNLPPGNFTLTVRSNQVRLEWLPVVKDHGGRVMREAVFK